MYQSGLDVIKWCQITGSKTIIAMEHIWHFRTYKFIQTHTQKNTAKKEVFGMWIFTLFMLEWIYIISSIVLWTLCHTCMSQMCIFSPYISLQFFMDYHLFSGKICNRKCSWNLDHISVKENINRLGQDLEA